MSRSNRRSAAAWVAVTGVAAALSIALPLTGAAKKPEKYLDKWVRVPFCGSITITRSGGGKGKLGGLTVEQSESGQITANITGLKDVVSPRTGRTYGFFLEGTVNSTFNYRETQTGPDARRWKWDLEATGQKQHSFEGKTDHWTELYVNRALGKYRFHPPAATAKGPMKVSTPGRSYTTQPDVDATGPVPAEVYAVEHAFDPAKGMISDSASFTWSKPIVGGDKADFNFNPDHVTYRPSEEKLEFKGRLEEAAKLVNQALPTGAVTFQVSWNLNLDTGACRRSVRITDPAEDAEESYGELRPNELWIPAYAEAKPKSYEQNIYPWDMSDIDGSTKAVRSLGTNCSHMQGLEAKPVKGPCVTFFFSKLPSDNAQFGKKTITADAADARHVKVFYKKLEKDNPEGKDPNWFYYWKQGAVPRLNEFKYSEDPAFANAAGSFQQPDQLTVYPQAALCSSRLVINLYERLPGFFDPYEGAGYKTSDPRSWPPIGGRVKIQEMTKDKSIRVFRTIDIEELKGVDRCHAVVLHELKHKWVYDSFHAYISTGALKDSDGDSLPDAWEVWTQSEYQFKPNDSDTHFLRYQYVEDYDWYGDNEVLAIEAMKGHRADHQKDWATPGKQSQNGDECNAH